MLFTLARSAGQVLSTDEILTRVWGAEFIGQPQVVYVHIRWLREKLEDEPNRPKRILTVRGVGYKYQPEELSSMKTLRSRLILNTLIPLLVIIPVMGILITYLLETQVFLGNLTNELTRQAVLVADTASAYLEIWEDPVRAQAFVTRISPRLTAKVMLLDPEGRLIVSSDPEDSFLIGQVFNVPDTELLSAKDLQAEVTMEERKVTDIIVPVYSSQDISLIGFVRLVNPLASIYERSQTLRQVMVFVLAGGLILGLLLSWLLARDLERPIRQTTDAAFRLASGRNPQPLPEGGLNETKVLQRAFNTLVERLQTMESKSQTFAWLIWCTN